MSAWGKPKTAIGIVSVIGFILLMFFGIYLTFNLEIVKSWTIDTALGTSTVTEVTPWIASFFSVFFSTELGTFSQIVTYLAVFMILLVALADILSAFSSFKPLTSWLISLGVAAIASVTGSVNLVAKLMGITAGVTAVGVTLIIIFAVITAVGLNYIMMLTGLKAFKETAKSSENADKAVQAYGHLRKVAKGVEDIDEETA